MLNVASGNQTVLKPKEIVPCAGAAGLTGQTGKPDKDAKRAEVGSNSAELIQNASLRVGFQRCSDKR